MSTGIFPTLRRKKLMADCSINLPLEWIASMSHAADRNHGCLREDDLSRDLFPDALLESTKRGSRSIRWCLRKTRFRTMA